MDQLSQLSRMCLLNFMHLGDVLVLRGVSVGMHELLTLDVVELEDVLEIARHNVRVGDQVLQHWFDRGQDIDDTMVRACCEYFVRLPPIIHKSRHLDVMRAVIEHAEDSRLTQLLRKCFHPGGTLVSMAFGQRLRFTDTKDHKIFKLIREYSARDDDDMLYVVLIMCLLPVPNSDVMYFALENLLNYDLSMFSDAARIAREYGFEECRHLAIIESESPLNTRLLARQ